VPRQATENNNHETALVPSRKNEGFLSFKTANSGTQMDPKIRKQYQIAVSDFGNRISDRLVARARER
jgi:hypothetical protein